MRALTLSLLLLAGLLIGGAGWLWFQQREEMRQVVYIIPAGTADRIEAGETVDVLPASIELERGVRDTLIIRNEDTRAIQVGPYLIGPGQQFRQRYSSRGTFDLLCTLHANQQMQVIVR